MVASFARDSPVLDVGGLGEPQADARWLLWPAWCWQILAPEPAERRMNTFERVVARMCRAGIHDPRRIADHTHLHPDLCDQILLMLRQQRLIDRNGNLTQRGADALAGEGWDTSAVRLVHVFQDPFRTQHLWTATRERLSYANVDYERRGKISLRLGSARDSTPVPLCVVEVSDVTRPQRPVPAQILEVSRQEHRPDYPAESCTPQITQVPTPAQVKRVSFVAQSPEPVYLVTCVFLPDDATTSGDWKVLDPFTGRHSPRLREHLEARRKDDRRLDELIAGTERQLAPDDAALRQENHQRQRAEAAQKVEQRLGVGIRAHDKILSLLTEIEASLAEGRVLDGYGGRNRQTAVNDAGKVLEHVFAALTEKHPLESTYIRMLEEPELGPVFLKDECDGLRKVLGVTSLPSGLQHQSSDLVARAARGVLPSFRPSLLVALLACARDPAHPLGVAIRERPELCEQLDNATKLRNDGAHRGDYEPTLKEADEVLDLVYWTVVHLLPISHLTSE